MLLAVLLVLSLAACGEPETADDYEGTWVAEPWTNSSTGVTYDTTLYLYDDYTFKMESASSENAYEEKEGFYPLTMSFAIEDDGTLTNGVRVYHREDW